MKGDRHMRRPSCSAVADRPALPEWRTACMLDQGSGKVINLALQAANVALLATPPTAPPRFGLVGLTKVLAFRIGRLWHHGQQDQPDRALSRARAQGLAQCHLEHRRSLHIPELTDIAAIAVTPLTPLARSSQAHR
jgi:hypothetical protein